jgi:molecular chaperone IbpA
MNNLARWETYSPYGIGLETFFNQLDKLQDTGKNFPPYNIVKVDDTHHTLEIALAGYSQDQLEVSVERNILSIRGQRDDAFDNREYSYRGLAHRNFERSWTLGDSTVIDNVTFVNGLLSILLKKEVPEEMKKKVLPINTHIKQLEQALQTS